MLADFNFLLPGILIAVQAAGIASSWLTRVCQGARLQPLCHALFLACLLLNGAATMAGIRLLGPFWLASAGTLGVMVVSAVCDFRPSPREFGVY